jgi:hypothetical protein
MKGTTQTEKIGTTPDDATATAGRPLGPRLQIRFEIIEYLCFRKSG